jgi:Family of unknown function (DUF6152)
MTKARLYALAPLAALGLAAGGGALAHHGWGSYDASKTVTIASPVERLEWQNPHVHVYLKHAGGTWEVVLAPPFRMEARGLSPELIKAGAQVQAEGYVSTRAEREMRAERISVAGKSYELR